jgi:hypothetical protein
MKTVLRPSLVLMAVLAAGGVAPSRAADDGSSFWSGKLYMVVVAEQPHPESKISLPTADHPAYFVAYDGGYIEEGDPIANEKPPAPADVAQVLYRSLAPQHYLPATDQSLPSVLLIYHWGLLNRDSIEIRSSLSLGPNERARIALVTTARYARMIEQDLLDERTTREMHARTWIPYFLNFRERDMLDLSRDDRYFVIVSAYDYAALANHHAKLLWRAKMSARSAGAAMATALPALLRTGAPYFGQNLDEPQIVKASEVPAGRVEVGTPKVEEFLPSPAVARELADPYVRRLVRREHIRFSGIRRSDAPADSDSPPPPAAGASSESFLPPPLAARINAYQHEKSSLQEALAASIKEHTPGADIRQAIDAFNHANAARIAGLTTAREAIRDELARLAAANTDATTGKSLNALQQEFAAGIDQLAAESNSGPN